LNEFNGGLHFRARRGDGARERETGANAID
jgi:hypothetical protein